MYAAAVAAIPRAVVGSNAFGCWIESLVIGIAEFWLHVALTGCRQP